MFHINFINVLRRAKVTKKALIEDKIVAKIQIKKE